MFSERQRENSKYKRHRGYTVLELMIGMMIVALILTWAVPAFQESMKNNRTASQNLLFVAMLNFTKSEAVRRSTDVNMLFTLRDDGWSVVVEDPNNEVQVEGCVPGQLRCATSQGTTLTIPSILVDDGARESVSDKDPGTLPQPDPDPVTDPTGDPVSEPVTFSFSFNNRGYIRGADDPWVPETFFIQHNNCSGLNQRFRIDITPTGQISSCSLSCTSMEACQ